MPKDLTAHAHWDDLSANSRLQLFQIMRELEIPYFRTATTDELLTIIRSRLDPKNKDLTKQVRDVFMAARYAKRSRNPYKKVRIMVVVGLLSIIAMVLSRVNFSQPYCSSDKAFKKCRPCPDGARCNRGKAKCPSGQFLSKVGCRMKENFRLYRIAWRGAKFIAQRDGDCVQPRPTITKEEFGRRFPSVYLSIYRNEPGFGVVFENGTMKSTRPIAPYACRLINWMDRARHVIGPIVIALVVAMIVVMSRVRHSTLLDEARELARQAHKILSTTDDKIYMYDIKVQLRAKNKSIDRLWKYVVRFIEEDSHVLVGVVGARHEVYWQWVHFPVGV